MKKFNSVGVPSLKSALKEYFKSLIDKGIYEVDVTCINSEIMQVIDNLPQLPAVPLDVHERTKRELNEEKQALIAGQETLQKALAEKIAEIERLQKENNQFAYIGKLYSEIKSEAIKELLDKIEKQAIPNEDDVYWVELDDIYNLVKEMAGEG